MVTSRSGESPSRFPSRDFPWILMRWTVPFGCGFVSANSKAVAVRINAMSFIMPLSNRSPRGLMLPLIFLQIRIRSTDKQPSAILERDTTGVGPEVARLGLIALRDHFGSDLKGLLREPSTNQNPRRTAFHHPVCDFTAWLYDIDMNPGMGLDPFHLRYLALKPHRLVTVELGRKRVMRHER